MQNPITCRWKIMWFIKTNQISPRSSNINFSIAFISYLSFVSDEVYFWFARLSWYSSWNSDFWCFFWFLDQHIDQSLFFVLWLEWDHWCSWCWCAWSLDEDDFVVFLSLTNWDGSLRTEFFRFWWWYMNVDVFLDCGATSKTTPESASASASEPSSNATSET